jgi:hypothetical protein
MSGSHATSVGLSTNLHAKSLRAATQLLPTIALRARETDTIRHEALKHKCQ